MEKRGAKKGPPLYLLTKISIFICSENAQYRRGPAIDPVDRRCQNWWRCSKCVKMDSGGSCLPQAQSFLVGVLII